MRAIACIEPRAASRAAASRHEIPGGAGRNWGGRWRRTVARALLLVGGILNLAFAAFHVVLFRNIEASTTLSPSAKGLMHALNGAGTLFIVFFVVVSLFFRDDLLMTRLGKLTLGLVAALYLIRAAEEFVLFKFSPLIFGSCAVVGGLYVAILLMAIRGHGPTTGTQTAG